MPVYTNPGPQQYAMHQQSRKDDWIRQLLQMFMMKQQRGTEEERWGKEYELSKTRTKAYETQADTQRMQAERPAAPPKVPEKLQVAQLLMKYGADTPEGKAIRKAYKITTPEDEAKAMEVFTKKEEIKANLKSKSGGLSEGGKAVQKRWEIGREEAKHQAKVTQDSTYVAKALTRFSKEKERMFTALGKLTDKKQVVEQEANIAHVDNAISMLDGINAQLRGGEPLPDEAYKKVTDILSNMKNIRQGLYNFETGEITPTINEKAVPKELRQNIMVNPQTGEERVLINDQWYKILKKK